MKIRTLLLIGAFFFSLISCVGQEKVYPELEIHRFDKECFAFLNDTSSLRIFSEDFLPLTHVFGEEVIGIGRADSIGFQSRLTGFFSEPTLMKLYTDEINTFSDISMYQSELSTGMGRLQESFPELKIPRIYMHVSGLNQNVVVTDEVLSVSADKYLGADYVLYQHFFYDYQRQLMSPDRLVPDLLLGFMMANFPFEGNEDILLDRILYEGKLRYILSVCLPERQRWEYVGYTEEQYVWCEQNHSRIWKSILGNKHLYTPDYLVTTQYLKEAPYTAFLPQESPGRAGTWVGYQIVSSFMKNHPGTSLQNLLQLTDAQAFLKKSKYKN